MKRNITYLLIAILASLGVASVMKAASANDRFFTASISPNDVSPGAPGSVPTNFNLTVVNDIKSGPTHFIQNIVVTVPAGFTIAGQVTVQAPQTAPLPWKVAVSGNTITATAADSSDGSVTNGRGVSITVPAIPPSVPCDSGKSYAWDITGNQAIAGGKGNTYFLRGSKPTVKITCDGHSNLSLKVDPPAINVADTSALVTFTATLKDENGITVAGEPIRFELGTQPVPCLLPAITNATGQATCSYYPQRAPNTPLAKNTYTGQAFFDGDSSRSPRLGSSVGGPVTLNVNATGTGLTVSPLTVPYTGGPQTATLTATLTYNNGVALANKLVVFALNSGSVGSATTDNSGVATLANVTLPGTLTAGEYDQYIKASFAGDSLYDGASSDATLTVLQQQGAISFDPASLTKIYTGDPQSPIVTTTPAGLSYSLVGGAKTDAGQYQVTATITDPNYSGSVTATFTINKANAAIIITPYDVTYDGNAHMATGTATGVKNENLIAGLNLTGTAHTNANSYLDGWTFGGVKNYNDASGTVTDKIGKRDATIVVTPYDVMYDGNSHTAIGTATGLNGVDLASGLNLTGTAHTNAGTYSTDSWTFSGGTNYKDASGTVTDKIAKRDATIVVTPYDVTYDGNSHTAIGTATGLNGVDLASGLNLTGTAHTNAGTYSLDNWTFSGGQNYNDASGTIEDKIAKAKATIVVTPYDVTYDGNAHTATGSAKGVNDVALSGLNLSGTTHDSAGSYSDAWSFSGGSNYEDAGGTISDSIAQAEATIVVTPYDLTYDGSVHSATGSAKGVKGETLAGLDLSGTAHTDAGSYTDGWSFAGGGNYKPASGTVTDKIQQATQSISFTSMIVTASATSGGDVTFSSGSPTVCTVNNVAPGQALVTLINGGSWANCSVLANQGGSQNYAPAPLKTGVLTVTP